MPRQPVYYCSIHGDILICPTCTGREGGKKTAKVHAGKHALWGKKGGRPKKKSKKTSKPRKS
jgi:hypothetical protein